MHSTVEYSAYNFERPPAHILGHVKHVFQNCFSYVQEGWVQIVVIQTRLTLYQNTVLFRLECRVRSASYEQTLFMF